MNHLPPRWKHDCPSCVYLGQYENADLYACVKNDEIKTLIDRTGEDGDYGSGTCFAFSRFQPPATNPKYIAYTRAIALGYRLDASGLEYKARYEANAKNNA